MATPEQTVADLSDKRMTAIAAQRSVLDRVLEEKRAATVEELKAIEQFDAEIDQTQRTLDAFISNEERQREREGLNAEYERAFRPTESDSARAQEARQVAEFFTHNLGGGSRSLDVSLDNAARWVEAYRSGARGHELRVIAGDTGASGGSLTVPTEVASDIYQHMTANVALRRMRTTILTTASGNPITFPRVATHGIATQVANQDTAFAGTDPVLSVMTLNSYDSGQLVKVGSDFVEDSGSDVLGFVAQNIGRAIGQHTAAWYVTGTGSSQPQGVISAAGIGSVQTGGSLIDPTVETMIDLEFAITDPYRQNAEWLMRDATAKVLRKLRDGAGGTVGAFLWVPSPTVGLTPRAPDTFMGYPVFTDPNVASLASNAKVVAFGDFSAYYIRDTRGLRLERSDDFAFDKNQISFRGLLRTDADLIDTNAIAVMVRNV